VGVSSERFDRLHPVQDGRERLDGSAHFVRRSSTSILGANPRRLCGSSSMFRRLPLTLMLLSQSFRFRMTTLYLVVHLFVSP
jgi:hypothetical protein